MVPIFPANFKVGLDEPALKSMTIEEYEKLGAPATTSVEDQTLLASLGVN
jgi:hypothetical protein